MKISGILITALVVGPAVFVLVEFLYRSKILAHFYRLKDNTSEAFRVIASKDISDKEKGRKTMHFSKLNLIAISRILLNLAALMVVSIFFYFAVSLFYFRNFGEARALLLKLDTQIIICAVAMLYVFLRKKIPGKKYVRPTQ